MMNMRLANSDTALSSQDVRNYRWRSKGSFLGSKPSTPILGGANWKLAREQRNDLVHDQSRATQRVISAVRESPRICLLSMQRPVGRHVASPKVVVALGVREPERTVSNLLAQVKLKV